MVMKLNERLQCSYFAQLDFWLTVVKGSLRDIYSHVGL